MKQIFFLIWTVLIIGQNQSLAQNPTFELFKKIGLPSGDGKWDYMNIEHDNLYVSHGDRIHIISLKTNQQIGEIDSLKGVHGIAIVNSLNKGYITNGTNNAITVFDNKTFKVINTVLIEGKKADAILYDKFSQRIFVFNNGSGNAIAIDVNTDKIVGKIEMGGAPEFAATNEKGSIFNNNEDTHEVIEIDSKTLTIKNRFPLTPNEVPTGLAIDLKNNRLFSVCRKSKTLVVLDATSGKIVSTLPIGAGVDGVIYDQESHLIFTSNGEGNVTIIQQKKADSYVVIQTLKTVKGQKTIVFDKKTHNIFLSGTDYSADGKTPASGTFGVSVYGILK